MTTVEFAGVLAYLSAAIGKRLSAESAEVYFDLLSDLPVEALRAAAKQVVLEHPWSTFPSVAEIREAATAIVRGPRLAGADAWRMAREFAAKVDTDIKGLYRIHRSGNGTYDEYPSQIEAFLGGVPKQVQQAIRSFGLHSLCSGADPESVVRGQFLKIFEQIEDREKRLAVMPQTLRREIESLTPALQLNERNPNANDESRKTNLRQNRRPRQRNVRSPR